MFGSRTIVIPSVLCAVFLGGYAAATLCLGPGHALNLVSSLTLCLAPLLANLGLLANTGSPFRRRNEFWWFWSAGCLLWSAGELLRAIPLLEGSWPRPGGAADAVFFLSTVPMLAALAVRPHRRGLKKALSHGYMDLGLLACWCMYLYGFWVLAPEVAALPSSLYQGHYLELVATVDAALLGILLWLWRRTRDDWRRVYAHLLGASALHAAGWLSVRWAIGRGAYFPGSLYELPLLASFLWFGLTGLDAQGLTLKPREYPGSRPDHRWPLRLAAAAIALLPALGAWAVLEEAQGRLRRFRVDLTLGGIALGILLLLLRHRQVDRERRSLLLDMQLSLERTNRLQTHLVLKEKLASLGELAAGAARELGDPLTAIFGYTDLLLAEADIGERTQAAAQKIQVQAHRTRALVENLLRFARQVTSEKALLDLNALLSSAVQLHRFRLSDRGVIAKLDLGPDLPAVRGDPKLLLQVFYEIITNAADAMGPAGGGRLVIRTRLEAEYVSIEFGDTGLGLEHPERVFDPFYTTKDVGKGAGLGLSMCYGIIQEHGGQISCRNAPEGGALFRIHLPAVLLPLQLKHLLESTLRAS